MERTSPFRPMSSYGRPRLRSQSPSRGALAIDMRRIASLLRDPGAALHTGESMNNSICSSPNSAWEPGDRGAAPTATPVRAVSLSRTVMQNQFSALAERINAGVTALQRQCETDRRRLAQLEKKFEARVADSEKHEGRERWAEVQGSVSGLLEETQALARRLDGLDERLWARTGGSEASKQRHREIEQQVQALEQASRLSAAAQEELQKRQATKIRRTEHSVEEVLRRLASLEDEVRQRSAPQREGYLDGKLQSFEQNQEALDAEIRALQANLEDGLQQLREEFAGGASEGAEHGNAFEAARKADQGLCSLERKLTGQVEDVSSTVASLRVKVDGLLSRVGGLAERLETAHEPSLSGLRQELSAARQQERQQLDVELQALRGRLQAAQEGQEEAFSELREALRQARAEAAALSYRPDVGEESGWMRSTEERLAAHEQELFDLRDRELTEEGKAKGPELEELRRRLEWLEEGAEKPETGRAAVQNSICELVEQVSKLKQQAASAEANASSWQQQVKQIHSLIERKQNEDAASLRVTGEVEARVGALSSQVADIAARLLEVEGNLDFVREPSLEATRSCEGQAAPNGLQEKLEAVAIHLEVVDDLSDRLAELERQLKPERGSPQPMSEVSFGGEAPVRPTEGLGLSELQLRLDAGDQKMKALQEELRTKLALSKAEGQQASTQLADLASRLGALEALGAPCSMADLDALRLELSDKEDLKPSELVEVRQELQELAEKVRGEMKAELKELRAHLPDKDAEASAEEAILEKLEEVDGKIKGFQKELAARPADGLKAELADLRQEQLAFQNDCEEKMNVWTKEQGHLKNRVSELRQLAEDVEHASELRKELKHLKLVVQEECLAHAFVPELRADVNALLQRPKAAPQASNELSELKEQVLALEQRLSEGGESEDLKARSQVQQQAQDLTLQLSKEVANLAETQKELVEANTTLEDMGRRLSELSALKSELEGTQRRGESGEKLLESLVKELRGVAERLQAVEGHGAELKRELQAVRVGPKVGISSGKESFLEEVQERLELLSEQVADLQSRQEAQAAPAAQRRHDSLASGDGSLNFSLTEQTERPGAAEGSLNFSLTEPPRRGSDAEELERKPKNLYINAEADSDAGAEILSAGDSPASARGHEAKSADSLISPKDASSSQVSASLNELSVYADHSVELSTELDEKCDFVEPVRKPLTLASAPIAEEPKEEEAKPSLASKQLAADALDALLRPKAKTLPPLEGKPKEATPMSKVEEESKEAKKEEVKPEVKEEVKKEEEKKEDSEKEDEYDDNSFDDNMSVPESIQEDSEMGSDAGSQDAV